MKTEQVEATCVPTGFVVVLVGAWQKLEPSLDFRSKTGGKCVCISFPF
jgi:hypothetical protein